MTRDEQKQISGFIERTVKGTGGGVLPVLDIEAEAIIRALFVRNPDTAYRMTMLAMAQARELEMLVKQVAQTAAHKRQGWVERLFKARQSRCPALADTANPGTGVKLPS